MAETFVCSVIIIRSPEKLAERPLHWHTTECCTMTVSFNLSMISLKQILRRTAMWRSSSLSRKRIDLRQSARNGRGCRRFFCLYGTGSG